MTYPHDLIEEKRKLCLHENRITVAEYLLDKLEKLGVNCLHTVHGAEGFFLPAMAKVKFSIEVKFWDNIEDAIWAATAASRCSHFSALFCQEHFLPTVFEGLLQASHILTPVLFIVQKLLRQETRELCGLPLSCKERGYKDLRQLIQRFSAAYMCLDDRKTAAQRIDKAIDAAFELLQPIVLDLPDEVAKSYIPSHTYRKTIFNYEENDLISSAWETILSRLEQAEKPLFILGPECWPDRWHESVLSLAHAYNATLFAAQDLWGHLPENAVVKGYSSLNSLSTDPYDSVFVFGIPADSSWLEAVLTNHDIGTSEQELFSINSQGIFFGNGKDSIQAYCLGEFFRKSPEQRSFPLATQKVSTYPSWHTLASMLAEPLSPLFARNDEELLCFLTAWNPFAGIQIRPKEADETWIKIAPQSWDHVSLSSSPIFIAADALTLIKVFEKERNLPYIFLASSLDTPKEELALYLGARPLIDIESCKEWKQSLQSRRKQPGLIVIEESDIE
jgi:hypothetical protein